MKPLVSVIVPCFNQAHFLNETLQSVLNQTYIDWECIIVNDGSPDNTDKVVKKWQEKDARFKYLEKENGGLSSARNSGIEICKGDFVLPLDSDDILHKDYLSKLVPELTSDDSLVIISCYSKFFVNNIENIIYELKPTGTTFHALLFENSLIASSLFRKKCWEEVGGYDEKMKKGFEDWEFWIALTKRGRGFKIIDEFLFFYRRTDESMLSDTLENHRISNLEYVMEKHKEFYMENYDKTIKYLFFLVNLYRDSESKTKASLEYKIGNIFRKPIWFFQSLFKK